MIRTQIYLTEAEKKELEAVAQTKGISQSELIRNAIDALLAKESDQDKDLVIKEVAGLWSSHEKTPDIRALRTDWNRSSSNE